MEAPQVEVATSMGTFRVELYQKHAPKTCKNFTELARKGGWAKAAGGEQWQVPSGVLLAVASVASQSVCGHFAWLA